MKTIKERDINWMVDKTGCNRETAQAYIEAEEGDVFSAVVVYRAERKLAIREIAAKMIEQANKP